MVTQVSNVQAAQSRSSTYGTSGLSIDITGGMLSSATGSASGASYSRLFLNRRSLETLGLPAVGQTLDDTQAMEVQVEVASVIGDSIKEKLKRAALADRSALGRVLSYIAAADSKYELYAAALKVVEDNVAVKSTFTAGTVTASSSSAEIDSLATATAAIITATTADLSTAQNAVDVAQSDVDTATSSLATLQLAMDAAQTAVSDYTVSHFDQSRATALTAAQNALSLEQSLLVRDQASLIAENNKPAIVQADLDALNATLSAATVDRDSAITVLVAKEAILTTAITARDGLQSSINSLNAEKASLDALKTLVQGSEDDLDAYVAALIDIQIQLDQVEPIIAEKKDPKAKGPDDEVADGVETSREEIVRPKIVEELKQMARRYEDTRLLDLADRVSRGEKLTDVIADKKKLTASLERLREKELRQQDVGKGNLESAGALGRNHSISVETMPDAPKLGRAFNSLPAQTPSNKEPQSVQGVIEGQPVGSGQPSLPSVTAAASADPSQSVDRNTMPNIAIAADAIAALNPRSFQMQDFLGAMEGLKNSTTNRDLLVPLSRLDETAQRKIAQQFISFSQNLRAAVDASNEIFELLKKRENPNPAGRIRVEM